MQDRDSKGAMDIPSESILVFRLGCIKECCSECHSFWAQHNCVTAMSLTFLMGISWLNCAVYNCNSYILPWVQALSLSLSLSLSLCVCVCVCVCVRANSCRIQRQLYQDCCSCYLWKALDMHMIVTFCHKFVKGSW